MYKKSSDSEIPDYVNLGNGTFEFCFNITSRMTNNFNNDIRIEWSSNCILVTDISSYENIFQCLIRDQYSVNDEFALINNYIYNPTTININNYITYQNFRTLFKNSVSNFINK